jgi:hypothetical protein
MEERKPVRGALPAAALPLDKTLEKSPSPTPTASARLLLVRQRPVHQRRRHAPERLPRGPAQGVNEFAKKKFEGDDVREGMVGAIAIRLKDPIFESQTKNKLGNTEIRSDLVNQGQARRRGPAAPQPKRGEKLAAKIEETQKLRKELQSVKKLARERPRPSRSASRSSRTARSTSTSRRARARTP